MVGEVHHCRSIGNGIEIKSELIVIAPGVACGGCEITGIVLVAIGAVESKHHGVTIHLCTPYLVLETFGTAMQGVGAIVDGKLIGFAIYNKVTFGYTVGISSGHFAGTRTIGYVIGRVSISYNHVGKRSIGLGKLHAHYSCAERRQGDLGTIGIGNGEQTYFALGRRRCSFSNFHGVEFLYGKTTKNNLNHTLKNFNIAYICIMLYAEILLPLPLAGTFSYSVPVEMTKSIAVGYRVVVPFGARKFYTGIVTSLGPTAPGNFEVKPIAQLLDSAPIIKRPQLQLWEWIADYYLCSTGEVFKAAMPAGLKVESETFIERAEDYEEDPGNRLTEREVMVLAVLQHASKRMSIGEIQKTTGITNVGAIASKLLEKGAVIISEKLVERYRSQKMRYVRLTIDRGNSRELERAFGAVKSARKQEKALMALMELSGFTRQGSPLREVTREELIERAMVAPAIIKALAEKGVLEEYTREVNRFKYNGLPSGKMPELSQPQGSALDQIHRSWMKHDVTLLHGVTSSGKTEIYCHLIDYVLRQGRQVLYLVPEIALTTQLTDRLQKVFGEKVVVYHSKFSDNERVDIWKRLLESDEPCVVIGARSSLFLPFSALGLVIVDEEHEASYKQTDPAPRYNGRDAAMVLARMHGAKTLLGSATPAIDTYYKALSGRYGLVELIERFGNAQLPDITIVDSTRARRRGDMHGIFSSELAEKVRGVTADGKGQAILFLNRRGFAPRAVCKMCGWTPKCECCDVALTYHRKIDKLVCHYCGNIYPLPTVCPACKEPGIEVIGYGTERVEDEVESTFPGTPILRMDLDTTRNKDGYSSIIQNFSEGKARILVGTQMVSKGLDFGNVKVVGIVDADTMLNMPDFRASERAFNMMEQLAGRAGRREGKGEVIIQTRQPLHPVLQHVAAHDYKGFYSEEIMERERYLYPPFTRLICIYIKHRDPREADSLGVAYGKRLRELFGNRVLGPEEPHVGRVQSFFIRKIMLKVELNASMKKVKEILRNTLIEMHEARNSAIRSAVVYYDVDPY